MAESASTYLDPKFLKKLESLSLASKRIFAGQTQGERRSPKRGSSVEFADFREYSLGDDLRYVDWKAYGRLEKLFLKLFVEEEDLNLHLLLDTSRSMEFGEPLSKAAYAQRVAAALGYIALSDYDRVSVAGFSSALGAVMPPARGKPGVAPFFRFLQQQTVGGGTRFGEALTQYAARARGNGIAVILSDFFDAGYVPGIQALLARRFQVVLIHILDPEEVNPSLAGDLRLIDSETGDTRDVSLSPYLLGQYQKELTRFCGDLQTLAGRYGMDYVRAVTDVPFEDVILKFLRTQSVLR
jgi:uncharacterized protein (DUF58 family)